MRIAVISDSHGPLENIRQAVSEVEPIDRLLFAGDGIRQLVDSDLTRQVKITAVSGNRDKGIMYPKEKQIELAGKKFLITHGDNYGVQGGLDNLYYRAREVGADVVIFGHTHRRYAGEENGVLFFNPGSIVGPRDQLPPAYGLIQIKNEKLNYEHREIT